MIAHRRLYTIQQTNGTSENFYRPFQSKLFQLEKGSIAERRLKSFFSFIQIVYDFYIFIILILYFSEDIHYYTE